MRILGSIVLCGILLALASPIAVAQKKQNNPTPTDEPLSKLVEKHFARWDRDHNGKLDLAEVDHVIADHNVHGRQTALIVCLRGYITDKKHQPQLTHDELLKLVDTKDFSKNVEGKRKHLDGIDRELFLANDPDLSTFSQGHLADCYLLAPIAAMAHRNPKSIRDMIHPEVTGGFQVHFGDGQKIHISPLTDAELLLGAKLDHRHGSWLAVLEKAYGIVRKKERAKKGEKVAGSGPIQSLNFGDSEPVIAMLTGHKAEKLMLAKSSHDQVHALLQKVTQKRYLSCVGKGDAIKVPGLVDGHIYAIMGYDPKGRHVNIFNPWGNDFTPKGDSGKSNGYSTKNGQFTMPLDQFCSIFNDVIHETDHPLGK